MEINLQPPAAAEIEVSLFGPGTGECVVAHLGNNEWMIVDSCTAHNKIPVALEYLAELGVGNDRVKLIVVTHFHDDHVGGLKVLIDACLEAEIYISGALTYEESISFTLAHALEDVLVDRAKPSTYELANVLKSVGDRHLRCVTENQVLYRRGDVLVHSLSPSSRAVTQSRAKFGQELLQAQTGYRKLANKLNPNLCAVALHICNGTDTVLLGSDLEVSADPALGWEAVLLNKNKPTTLASLFKIPHHGSENGYSARVVSDMLKVKPISILTTFNRSALPLETDIARIMGFSESLYYTSHPKSRTPVRSRSVEEGIHAVVKARRVVTKQMGHIQVRMQNGVCKVAINSFASVAA
jgi:beta-lactamase superfamily II metal-dependent hydrolase